MLYVIWSVVLMMAGLVLSYRSSEKIHHALVAIVLEIYAIVLVASDMILPAYQWICKILPNQGEAINYLTAGVILLAVVGSVLVFGNAKLGELGEKKFLTRMIRGGWHSSPTTNKK